MAKIEIGATIKADVNGANDSVKSFKTQLREAQAEVVKLSEQFGPMSKEAAAAAQKAAMLKDAIGDAKELTEAFNPDKKFAAFGASINGVTGGLTAVSGLMGLIGGESEDLTKQLVKVQSAMAFSQGLNQLTGVVDQFKNMASVIKTQVVGAFSTLKGAIAATGLGLLITAVITAIEYFKELADSAQEAADAEKEALEIQNENASIRLKGEEAYITRQKELAVARAKNQGKSDSEIFAIQQQYENMRLASLKDFYSRVDQDSEQGINAATRIKDIEAKIEVDKLNFETDQHNKQLAELKKFNKEKAKAEKNKGVYEVQSAEGLVDPQEEQRRASLAKEKSALDISVSQVDASLKAKFDAEKEYNDRVKALSDQRIATQQEETDAKIELANIAANALGNLAGLVGKQTAAGKALALAEIAAGTGVAFIQGLDIAQKTAKGTGPAAAFAFPIFYATQIAAIIGAAARAKAALSGGGVSSGSSGGVVSAAPLTPQLSAQTTQLNDIRNQINDQGNQAVRAYVITTDVTKDQEKIARVNRAARIG